MIAPHSAAARALSPHTIVVGLGSPHGDDQVGWLLADEVAMRCAPHVAVRSLTVPVNLLSAIESFGRVILIDAVRSDRTSEPLQRWEWPSTEIARARVGGTHALGLAETLELAQSLGQLPEVVVIWGVCGECFAPGDELSPSLRDSLPVLADEIIDREQLLLTVGV